MKYIYLFLSVAFNVVSYLVYKSISNKPGGLLWNVLFASGLILGGINVLFFTKALKDIPLSVAYPIVFRRVYLLNGSIFPYPLRGKNNRHSHRRRGGDPRRGHRLDVKLRENHRTNLIFESKIRVRLKKGSLF